MAGHTEGGAGALPGRKLLKLLPLGVSQVPRHSDLHAEQNSPPGVAAFVTQCLKEATEEDFSSFHKMGEARENVDTDGKKHPIVIEKLKKKDDVEGTWFARRSLHEEVSYEELDEVLRKDHERNEMEYTPAIYDVNTLLEWHVDEEIEGVRDVNIRITQMHHSMPAPALLNDRVFTVLLVSFIPTRPVSGTLSQSIDLQLPVDLSTFPPAVREQSHVQVVNAKHIYKSPESGTAFQKKQDGRKIVEGRYVSLEKIAKVEKDGKMVSKWEMTTNSDAEGSLPLGVQKLGVPGAIVKDVPLAIKHIINNRPQERGMNGE
ncbi:uncharacterized protein N0V89_012520 [Didymosphaeria variabile]|uniref:DUF3074 domain-containing protein n=1 Tax=Didymosphaeria variabile TaxID=1932322 RepID=A0A9W9C5I0_9PLEO|nr:uncharacterized protein N0V89_012520 [Didymosphaeria variabile]KAJ4344776.1 hypothetical protein N0V89_012520 [Didymosphaeria variabile]